MTKKLSNREKADLAAKELAEEDDNVPSYGYDPNTGIYYDEAKDVWTVTGGKAVRWDSKAPRFNAGQIVLGGKKDKP